MQFGGLTRVDPGNHVLDGVQIPQGKGKFWGFPAHLKALGVSVAVNAAKGIIQSSITARHAMQPFVKFL